MNINMDDSDKGWAKALKLERRYNRAAKKYGVGSKKALKAEIQLLNHTLDGYVANEEVLEGYRAKYLTAAKIALQYKRAYETLKEVMKVSYEGAVELNGKIEDNVDPKALEEMEGEVNEYTLDQMSLDEIISAH